MRIEHHEHTLEAFNRAVREKHISTTYMALPRYSTTQPGTTVIGAAFSYNKKVAFVGMYMNAYPNCCSALIASAPRVVLERNEDTKATKDYLYLMIGDRRKVDVLIREALRADLSSIWPTVEDGGYLALQEYLYRCLAASIFLGGQYRIESIGKYIKGRTAAEFSPGVHNESQHPGFNMGHLWAAISTIKNARVYQHRVKDWGNEGPAVFRADVKAVASRPTKTEMRPGAKHLLSYSANVSAVLSKTKLLERTKNEYETLSKLLVKQREVFCAENVFRNPCWNYM